MVTDSAGPVQTDFILIDRCTIGMFMDIKDRSELARFTIHGNLGVKEAFVRSIRIYSIW